MRFFRKKWLLVTAGVASAVWSLMDRILVRIILFADGILLRAMTRATAVRYVGPPVTGWWRPTRSSGNRGLHIYVRGHSSRTKLNGINTRGERMELLNQIRINTWREMLAAHKKARIKDAMDRFSI